MEVRNAERMERMKRSQSSNARPRTRLSRSFSATSSRKHGWKVSIAVAAGGALLLMSVLFLQSRLGGFRSPIKSIQGGTGTYEDDENVVDVESDKLKLFDKFQQRKLVDGGGTDRKSIEMDDSEEGEELGNFDVKVDGKLEELDEDETDVDDAGVDDIDLLKQDDKSEEDYDDESDESERQDLSLLEENEGDESELNQEEVSKSPPEEEKQVVEGLEAVDNVNMTVKRLERLGQVKTLPRRSPEVHESSTLKGKENNFLWDHLLGIIKMPVQNKSNLSGRKLGMGKVTSEADLRTPTKENLFFSSDDQPMDSKLRQGVNDVADVEDALLLRKEKQLNAKLFGAFMVQKQVPPRNVFDTKFARKVAKPPYDPANPTGNSLLQDPDTVEPWGLTKSDKAISKVFRSSLDEVPAPEKKSSAEQVVKTTKRRKELLAMHEEKRRAPRKRAKGDNRRWGWYPGLDMLSFSEFMEQFMMYESCELRVFMSWNTPPWSFTVRHQRGLESLLHFHPKACVTVFSETLELDFFKKFVQKGYRVAVVRPNLEEFLEGTPAEVFSSVWLQWRKTDLFYVHYSELLRLAALYRYGGIYLDSDMIVLKPLNGLRNCVGLELPEADGNLKLNGAVMVFHKKSHFIRACLEEYTAAYDDKLLDWNGAELLTRVARNTTWPEAELRTFPPDSFFPLSRNNITRYFHCPVDTENLLQSSYTLHLWNRESASLVPDRESLVGSVLERHCIWCSDII